MPARMSPMSDVTREQFASAVAAAILSVQHLYHEVDRLFAELRVALAEGPHALGLVRGTQTKVGGGTGRLVVRPEYGALFGPVAEDDMDDDEEEDEENADEDGDDGEQGTRRARTRRLLEILAEQPCLAVRIAVYDPDERDSFEPQLQYGLMNEWATPRVPFSPEQRFQLEKYMLRRLPRALAGNVGAQHGRRIVTAAAVSKMKGAVRSRDRCLSCTLPAGVLSVPLFSLDSADSLGSLVKRMKEMWAEAPEQS